MPVLRLLINETLTSERRKQRNNDPFSQTPSPPGQGIIYIPQPGAQILHGFMFAG